MKPSQHDWACVRRVGLGDLAELTGSSIGCAAAGANGTKALTALDNWTPGPRR